MSTVKQVQGCLLGLALGDAFNAALEGGPIERFVWRLIGTTSEGKRRYTDDTQMSLDIAHSLLACQRLDLDDIASRFATQYRWSRGYGPGAAKLLKRIRRGVSWQQANRSIYPNGSYGNGGAMRAPVIGMAFAHNPRLLTDAARQTARITHAHELGMQGSVLIAQASAAALRTREPLTLVSEARRGVTHSELASKLDEAVIWLTQGELRGARQVAKTLGNGMTVTASCPTALYISCAHLESSFEQMAEFAGQCGGDTDTITAMAGAIWGAARGVDALPIAWLEELEDMQSIRETAMRLARCSSALAGSA